jgi:hypothetical protein
MEPIDYIDICQSMNNLGNIYQEQGKLKEAE